MRSLYARPLLAPAFFLGHLIIATEGLFCRNLPGDADFPSIATWEAFNATIDGRLMNVIPMAKFCHELPSGQCNEDMWESTVFRSGVPGAMDNTNWEQDYSSIPPSLCLQNGTTCGQGNVPVFGVNATDASHIQHAVKFASKHNLRVAVKASGHDFLGRSTARGSLLLWTHHLQNVTFTDSFVVGGKQLGSAMTIGSGVPANELYEATKRAGKGRAFGIFDLTWAGADNALAFEIVVANGSLIEANEAKNPDLFFALRGGGAGSWVVITSATFRTFPTFTAVNHNIALLVPTNASTRVLAEVHARHIFDYAPHNASQYFSFFSGGTQGNAMALSTFFPNSTEELANATMQPFLDDVAAAGINATVISFNITTDLANDLMFSSDVQLGINDVLGSRLIPMEAYRTNVEGIGKGIEELLELGVPQIIGHNLIGGKVAENANINSAVNPKWRTAQTHVIAAITWPDSFTRVEVEVMKEQMTNQLVPILVRMTNETDSGAYSNEADVREPDFQTTFFGVNYPKLKGIKDKYDPNGLFIVPAGVGSEDWDAEGVCRVK